ncbi:unnamed protein product [Penicillium camemberti]|uniref:Str. FM013 n=1 Tax=Penicillium camemberti (strain FM 013) TaxID=1429867 RepID=A0A0G4PGJ4_PENC3|nr:unnamed protein product [Penicillium camemberti]
MDDSEGYVLHVTTQFFRVDSGYAQGTLGWLQEGSGLAQGWLQEGSGKAQGRLRVGSGWAPGWLRLAQGRLRVGSWHPPVARIYSNDHMIINEEP